MAFGNSKKRLDYAKMDAGFSPKRLDYAKRTTGYISPWNRLKKFNSDFQLLSRLFLCFLTTAILCITTRAWYPSFTFIGGACPNRAIVSLYPFSVESDSLTNQAKESARFDTPHVYIHHPEKLTQYKEELVNRIASLLTVKNFSDMSPGDQQAWDFLADGMGETKVSASLADLQAGLAEDTELKSLRQAINTAFDRYAQNGIIQQPHEAKDGNLEMIRVYDEGSDPSDARDVPLRDVLAGNMYQVKDDLSWGIYSKDVSSVVFKWIEKNIPTTLEEDKDATAKAKNLAADLVEPQMQSYQAGEIIIKSEQQLTPDLLNRLKTEYREILNHWPGKKGGLRILGMFFLLFTATVLMHLIVYTAPASKVDHKRSLKIAKVIFITMVGAIVLGRILQNSFFGQYGVLELIPLIIFAQLVTLSLSWQIGFVVGLFLTLVLSISGTEEISPFLVMTGALTVSTFSLKAVHSRSELFLLSLICVAVTFVVSVGAGYLEYNYIQREVYRTALKNAGWVLTASVITQSILPVLEKYFKLVTPMSLNEMANPSNEAIRWLKSVAPATYSHSMSVAQMAEDGALAIKANPLLVRAGAYFHDLGKGERPKFFTENQDGGNPHDGMETWRSSQTIMSHVADGVVLSQTRYHLPKKITDFIEQHHGTFTNGFYNLAMKKAVEANPDDPDAARKVDINLYRYPGPKPQSKEAGILMLADAIESVGRSFDWRIQEGEEPTAVLAAEKSRKTFRTIVRKIIQDRIDDGQFDESGLTVGDIRKLEESLFQSAVKLNHLRVKYADQNQRKPISDSASENPAPAAKKAD